jgi:hypothetical protein
MIRRLTILVLILAALPAAAKRRAVAVTPPFPPCAMVTGTAAVTFTHDFGQTLAPSAEPLRPIAYTYGLTPMLDEPDTFLAWHRDDLLISTDAGCSWRVEATVEGSDFPPRITPARGGRAYAWSDNRRFLVRYDSRGTKVLKQPADFVGLGVDPQNGERLRGGGTDGTIWESVDAGETWTFIGALEGQVGWYRFTFDPKDIDHVLAGTVVNGAHVSRDGGRTWARATGMGAGTANAFELVFSPVDSTRVWAMGIDLADSSKRIYVSSDGGATYEVVIDDSPEVTLVNQPIMAAHPTDPNVLFFVFGTHIFQYGTDIFRYDLTSRVLRVAHNTQDDVNAIAFSPRDPHLMYLGLEGVD